MPAHSRLGLRALGGVWMLALAAGAAAAATLPNASADNAYLENLLGDWDMPGTFLGKPVRYHAHGERVLQGGFVRLHLIDAAAVPQYEADVFLGADSHAGDYVVHWLDRFGAEGARVVGTGKREGMRLILFFPYAEGTFRDTFDWKPESRSWSLVIEDHSKQGAWSTFASYDLQRNTAR